MAAYEDRFKPSLSDHNFRDWGSKGLTAMCTLTKNGNEMSFQELKMIYGLENGDLFRYLQLRDYFIKEIQAGKTLNGVLDVMIRTYSGTKLKAVSVSTVPKSERLRSCFYSIHHREVGEGTERKHYSG